MNTLETNVVQSFVGGGIFAGKILPGTPTCFCERPNTPGSVYWDRSIHPRFWPWGTYGINACHELRWTQLGLCSNEHLEAILGTQVHIPPEYRRGIVTLLNMRAAGLLMNYPETITLERTAVK